MEPSGGDSQETKPSFPPTVSKEKWHSHILTKLARGYVLIVGVENRNAKFFKIGKGYESCAFDVARHLVKTGVVVKAYDHYLGTAYTLAEPLPVVIASPPPPKPDRKDVKDPMALLLDELADDVDEDDDLGDDLGDDLDDDLDESDDE